MTDPNDCLVSHALIKQISGLPVTRNFTGTDKTDDLAFLSLEISQALIKQMEPGLPVSQALIKQMEPGLPVSQALIKQMLFFAEISQALI